MATGNITLNDLQTRFKAAGVYTVYRDLSAAPAAGVNPILRLIAGFSKIGIFNTPVFINQGDVTTFESLFGKLDKSLERKGSFFHRTCLAALEEGPILALNLLKLNNEVDENGVPTDNADVVDYKSFSVDVAALNGDNTPKLFSSYFDKERFWKPSKSYLLATRKTLDQGSIFNLTNLSQTPLSFIIRKSTVKGFDVTVKEWYGSAEIPAFLKSHDYISDYFIDVIVIAGDFGPSRYAQLATDPIFGAYFDINGLIISQLDNFLARQEVVTKQIYTGALIPNFRDKLGVSQYIEDIINSDTRLTGVLCAVDRSELDKFIDQTNTHYLDLVGHRLLSETISQTDFLSYKKKITQDYILTKKDSNDQVFDIVGINNTLTGFVVEGDQRSKIAIGQAFTISGSTGNDGSYNVVSRTFDGTNTIFGVSSIPSPVADGEITVVYQLLDSTANITVTNSPNKITVTVTSSNTNFADLKTNLELGMYFRGNTTAAGSAAGITIANPVLEVTRVLKTTSQVTFDVTSPLKNAESTSSGSFVDLLVTSTFFNYTMTRDRFYLDGTNTYYIADTDSVIADEIAAGNLTNGDKVTDGTNTYFLKFDLVYAQAGIDAVDDFRSIYQITLFTDEDLTIPISSGQAILFGTSVDSNGYPISASDEIDFISLVGSVNARYDATFVSPKVVRIPVADKANFKIGYYLVGYDQDNNEILTRIISIKNYGSPTPTHIEVETLDKIKQFVSVSSDTQVERFLPLTSFYDRYNFTYLSGFTLTTDHLPNNTNSRMKDIQSVMTDTNLRDALIDPEMIDFRYFVDTWNHGLESQSKRQLSRLIRDRQKCLGIINCPSITEFRESTNPRFTSSPTAADPLPLLKTEFILAGGNLEENPDFLYTMPDEEDGASYMGFFFPNLQIRDDDGETVSAPPAGFVSNNFMKKYKGGNPFLPTAGPRRGIITGTGLSGVEYDLTQSDRGNLEQKGINPIFQKKNGDIMIFGNETAFKKFNSVLNNLNVRDTLVTITIDIENILSNYLFEFNDDALKTEVSSLLKNYLSGIQTGFGAISSYDIIFDRNNNPGFVVRENAAIVDVIVEPADVVKKFINRITLKKNAAPAIGGFVAI